VYITFPDELKVSPSSPWHVLPVASAAVAVNILLQVLASHLGPPVSLFPLTMPMNASWFPPESVTMGLGGVSCRDIVDDIASNLPNKSKQGVRTAMTVLIGRRCRCAGGRIAHWAA
jgi:hypothetical protein